MRETSVAAIFGRGQRRLKVVTAVALTFVLAGCAAQIDRHGHVLNDADLQQIQPGMSKDQVKLTLGSPDTTATIGGGVYYYISSTRRTRPASRPKVIDRKVVAVYFDQNQSVQQIANYGLKDGRVFDFIKGETPSQGKDTSILGEIFGNIGTRRELAKQQAQE